MRLCVFLILASLVSCASNRDVVPNPQVSSFMQEWSKGKDPKMVDRYTAYLTSVEQLYWKTGQIDQFEKYLESIKSDAEPQLAKQDRIIERVLGKENLMKLKKEFVSNSDS